MTTKKPAPKPTPDERKPKKTEREKANEPLTAADNLTIDAPTPVARRTGFAPIALSPVASVCACCGNVRVPPCPTRGN